MPVPLVVFVDRHLAAWVRSARARRRLDHLSVVIERDFEDLPAHGLLAEAMSLPMIRNGDPAKDTARHAVLTWSKLDLVEEIIDADPFGTESYAWIDLGIGHIAIPPAVPLGARTRPTVHQLRPVFPHELEDRREFHGAERGRIAGGLIRGDRTEMRALRESFLDELDLALSLGRRPTDQTILSALAATRPDAFEYSFGDYRSILRNAEGVRGDVADVLANAEDCRAHGETRAVRERCAAVRAAIDAEVVQVDAATETRLRALERDVASQGGDEPTGIVLCMIVRDEAAVLRRCLESVRDRIDSWVIVDTGSVDGTPEIVHETLADIPGELHRRPWRDFGTNRSELLELARGTGEYLLLLDADMTVEWEQPLPGLSFDAYHLRQHDGGLEYRIPRLVRSDRAWQYVGATHEYLTAAEGTHSSSPLDALRVVHHADGGSRTDKFERDRKLLEDALERDPDDPRSTFYLAQTYRDLGDRERAIELYRRRVALGGWDEEVFYAAFQAGVLVSDAHWAAGMPLLFDAWERRPSRAEPLYEIAVRARAAGEMDVAHVATTLGVDIPRSEDALFVHTWVYEWGLRFEHSVACAHVGDLTTARRLTVELRSDPAVPNDLVPYLEHNMRWLDDQPDVPSAGGPVPFRRRAAVPGVPLPLLCTLAPGTARLPASHVGDAARREMNPTIASDGVGFRAIIRSVNYELVDGRYRMLDDCGAITTVNHLVHLDERLQVVESRELDDLVSLPRFQTGVRGFEDCRIFAWRDTWWATATSRDVTADGICRMVLLELDGTAIRSTSVLDGPDPTRHEKNWAPFVRDGALHFLYSAHPAVVLRERGGALEEVARTPTDRRFTHLRGGSQGLPVDDGFLFVVHEAWDHRGTRRYAHRFMTLGPDLRPSGVSAPWAFVHDGIEFCAGLAMQGDDLVLSYGLDDRSAELMTVPLASVIEMIDPVPRTADVDAMDRTSPSS